MSNTNTMPFPLPGFPDNALATLILRVTKKTGDIKKKIDETANELAAELGEMVTAGKEKVGKIANAVTEESKGLVKDISKRAKRIKKDIK